MLEALDSCPVRTGTMPLLLAGNLMGARAASGSHVQKRLKIRQAYGRRGGGAQHAFRYCTGRKLLFVWQEAGRHSKVEPSLSLFWFPIFYCTTTHCFVQAASRLANLVPKVASASANGIV